MISQYDTQLKYRALDENGDMTFGLGEPGFKTGLDAMTQVLKTRIAAGEDEWWEDDPGALPYFTEILGGSASDDRRQAVDLMIIDRIMSTVGVISASNVASSIVNRNYRFSCTAATVYGTTSVEVSA